MEKTMRHDLFGILFDLIPLSVPPRSKTDSPAEPDEHPILAKALLWQVLLP